MNIGLLGFGNVGQSVLDILIENQTLLTQRNRLNHLQFQKY